VKTDIKPNIMEVILSILSTAYLAGCEKKPPLTQTNTAKVLPKKIFVVFLK
jgi:hypothetical protein